MNASTLMTYAKVMGQKNTCWTYDGTTETKETNAGNRCLGEKVRSKNPRNSISRRLLAVDAGDGGTSDPDASKVKGWCDYRGYCNQCSLDNVKMTYSQVLVNDPRNAAKK